MSRERDIPLKCKNCPHRLKSYCRGYQVKIELIDTSKCKRKKGEKKRILQM